MKMARLVVGNVFLNRILFGCVCVFGLLIASTPVIAQWTSDDIELAGRFDSWEKGSHALYSPFRAIGASSLAFGPNDTLFLACEKFPTLLMFAADGSEPRYIELQGVRAGSDGQPEVDLEAIAILDGSIYLIDEDKLVIYKTSATPVARKAGVTGIEKARVTEIEVLDGRSRIDITSTTSEPTDHSSVEGMVVTMKPFGSRRFSLKAQVGPFFYLLDERDVVKGRNVAKLYVGVIKGDGIELVQGVVSFDLGVQNQNFRLCELFEHDRRLFALMTCPPRSGGVRGVYKVMECNLATESLVEICDFSSFAADPKYSTYDTNFEGAAVSLDKRLFLTSDNESFRTGGKGPPPDKGERGVTPIVTLKKK